MTSSYIEGDAYLQIRRHQHWSQSELRIMRATQRRPEVIEPGCVVVKIRLRMPLAAFLPLQPEAVVTVPEDLVQHPVEAEAVQP